MNKYTVSNHQSGDFVINGEIVDYEEGRRFLREAFNGGMFLTERVPREVENAVRNKHKRMQQLPFKYMPDSYNGVEGCLFDLKADVLQILPMYLHVPLNMGLIPQQGKIVRVGTGFKFFDKEGREGEDLFTELDVGDILLANYHSKGKGATFIPNKRLLGFIANNIIPAGNRK